MRILLLGFVLGTVAWAVMIFVPSPMVPALARAGDDVYYWTPPVGDPDRKGILDALRPVVEQATGGPVRFVVDVLRTDGHWAFAQGIPQRPGGHPIDWSRTPMAEEWRMGMMDEGVMGLIARSEGGWRLVEYAIGPTDVPWVDWAEHYGLPFALFQAGS